MPSSNTYSEMSDSTGKCRKTYFDHPMVDTNPDVSYISPVIHQMNARSWGNLVLSTLKLGLLRTADTILQTERNLTSIKIIMLLLTFQLIKSSRRKIEEST